MVDRREAVARAMYTAMTDENPEQTDWEIMKPVNVDDGEDAYVWYLDAADAAIAAMQAAEPTDAEVKMAREAYYEYLYREDLGADYAMRAALIAARKVSQP
jgi:hypothetical protein